MTNKMKNDYIARIDNGESPLTVFPTVKEYKACLTDFMSKFEDISGIFVQPGICIAVFSKNGFVIRINDDRSTSGNMHHGGPTDQALLSDLSMVKWMLDAFAKATAVPKQVFIVGYVHEDWHRQLTHS